MKNSNTKEQPIADIFELTEFEIPLTYDDLIPGHPLAMKFFFHIELVQAEVEARQVFFGLTDAEREEKKHEHYANRIALLMKRPPEGVPGFPDSGNLVEVTREFFNSTNPLKRKIAQDLIVRYEGVTQPREFFRRF